MQISKLTKYIFYISITAAIIIPASGLFARDPVILDEKQDEYVIGKNIEYLEDENKKYSINDVISPEMNGKFALNENSYLNFGYTRSAYWLRFTLKNEYNTTKSWIFLNDYPLTDDIKIYIPDLYGAKLVKHGGRFLPHSAKDEDYRSFAFKIDVPPVSEHTYYVRIESEDSLASILSILSYKKFLRKKNTTQLFLGIYYGFILAMIIYYLFIYFSTRDPVHLHYVLTLVFLHFLFQFSLNGLSYEYIDGNSLWWARESIVLFETIGVCFAMQFAKSFLNLKENAPFLHKLFNVLIPIVLIIATLSFFLTYFYLIMLAVIMTMCGAALTWTAGVVTYIRGFRAARYYLLAWTAIQFFGCFYGLKTLGLFPSMFISEWGFQIGSLAHSFLMSFGLVDLINIMRNEKDRALNEAMSLKEEMNVKLEAEVNDRTKELMVANKNLISARDALWGEMELAKKIQTVLLPEHPQIKGYQISGYMQTADMVGGDYYDVINVNGLDWIIIGDVSGHGVPAGLIMMMVQTSIHSVLSGKSNLKPTVLLRRVNAVITENIKKLNEDKYMTITVLACLKDGKFFYSGLHQDIMIYRADKKDVEMVETNGIWLGLMDDIRGMVVDEELILQKNDVMLLYSDGITEAWREGAEKGNRDPAHDMYSDEQLVSVLKKYGHGSPDFIKDGIVQSLNEYRCDDDVTMLILKRNGE